MCRFVRFHTQIRDSQIHHELGIFVALRELECRRRLSEDEQERVREAFGWFNDHLRVPRLEPEHWRARFWFRDSAQPMVRRLWEVVAVLRQRDVPVQFVITSEPGTIVYRDHYQVAAIPCAVRRR